jgi:ABC-type nickel/cobalt efflux system permease component RcnA
VGSRGTTKHAVFLGLTVTLTHTSSVFALGFVALALQDYILPEQLFPWLSFVSGAMIAALGAGLLLSRTRTLLRGRRPARAVAVASSAPAQMSASVLPHAHGRMRHYQPEAAPSHSHRFGRGGQHDHGGLGSHSHGGRAHSHLPPGATGERVTWRSLLALGVAGGIIPCPSAMVVLLAAISIGRIGYGMLLIVAFSVGLASVLTGIGLLLVHARGLFRRLPVEGLIARALPVASAAVVTALGVGIVLRALTGISGIAL